MPGPPGSTALPGVHDLAVRDLDGGAHVTCQVDATVLDELLKRFTAVGVRSLTCQPPSLEELFLRHYAGAAADERTQ